MAILKFRISYQEDDSIYRDINVHHKNTFAQLHEAILKAFEFDAKHEATFYRSNNTWQRGKEITLVKYEKNYVVEPILMSNTTIGSQIFTTTEKFIYQYDFTKNWVFTLELISVSKEETNPNNYPLTMRKEGIAPSQYGTKGLMGNGKVTEVEEKYDLSALVEGYGTEGEPDDIVIDEEDGEDEAEEQEENQQLEDEI